MSHRWEFSESIQGRIREFAEKVRLQNVDSPITRHWQYLYNVDFDSCVDKSPVELLNETIDAQCDIDGLTASAVEAFESGTGCDETKFKDVSTSQMLKIFTKVDECLTDSGFTNFCQVLSKWENVKLLNVCFDVVILHKLLEKEEASLTTINAIREVGRCKPEYLSKCMIKLLTNKEHNFSDAELLEQVFDVLPDNRKEDITRAIIDNENFEENNWQLLQVLSFKTTTTLHSIVMFMNSKCDEFAYSQTFARLLVHICKNLQSDKHKEVLMNVLDKNQCLLKHQAKKYLMSV